MSKSEDKGSQTSNLGMDPEAFQSSSQAAMAMANGVVQAVGAGWTAYTQAVTQGTSVTDMNSMASPNRLANGVVRGYASFFQSMANTSQDALKILGGGERKKDDS